MNSTLRAIVRPLHLALACLTLTLLPACGGGGGEDGPKTGREAVEARKAEAAARAEKLRATARARDETAVDPATGPKEELKFASIAISPEEPKANTESFRVRTTLEPGASPYTEVEFRWFVDGAEVIGQKNATLRLKEGKWTTGDTVEVIAVATDETGRTATSERIQVVIDNTPPVITTDLTKIKYLSGTQLRAHDEDGDEVTWSVEGDPPGVTISRTGVVNVRNVQVAEDWNGEAIFVATDPHGARSEIHIPLSVNAAKEGRVEEAGTREDRTTLRTMSDAELNEKAEEDVKRFETMTDEEVNAELDRRDKLNAQGGQ